MFEFIKLGLGLGLGLGFFLIDSREINNYLFFILGLGKKVTILLEITFKHHLFF